MKKSFFFLLLIVPFFAQSQTQDYLGQWRNSDTTELIEITTDTIFHYKFNTTDCYDLSEISFSDIGGDALVLSIQGLPYPITYTFENSNSILNFYSSFDTTTYYAYDFDDYSLCSDSSITDSSYIGQWKVTTPSLMYLEFTSDSLFIYRFDSVDCYTINNLTCMDVGSNQLLISGLLTTTYSISEDGNVMLVNIVGFGDLQLDRTPFNVSSWVECTYNWNCNVTLGCEEVGLNEGTFNNEQDCEAVCQVDTTSISEYDLDVKFYPNPFSDYLTIDFMDKATHYQLYDMSGRLLLDKPVIRSVDYLYKNDLSNGVYLLYFMGYNKIRREKIVIQ